MNQLIKHGHQVCLTLVLNCKLNNQGCMHYKKATGEFLSSTKMKGSGAGRGIRRSIFGHRDIWMSRVNITIYAAIMQNEGSSCQNCSLQHRTHTRVFRQTLSIGQTRYRFQLFQYLPQHSPFLALFPSAWQWKAYELWLGLHNILHAIVMHISPVKTVLWLAVNLHQLFSNGAAFNAQSRRLLTSYAISHSLSHAIHLWFWAHTIYRMQYIVQPYLRPYVSPLIQATADEMCCKTTSKYHKSYFLKYFLFVILYSEAYQTPKVTAEPETMHSDIEIKGGLSVVTIMQFITLIRNLEKYEYSIPFLTPQGKTAITLEHKI